jgi:hypothetical protein
MARSPAKKGRSRPARLKVRWAYCRARSEHPVEIRVGDRHVISKINRLAMMWIGLSNDWFRDPRPRPLDERSSGSGTIIEVFCLLALSRCGAQHRRPNAVAKVPPTYRRRSLCLDVWLRGVSVTRQTIEIESRFTAVSAMIGPVRYCGHSQPRPSRASAGELPDAANHRRSGSRAVSKNAR